MGLFGEGDFSTGRAGGYLDAEARLNGSLSAFGEGRAGYDWQTEAGFWQALTGLRWTW